MKHTDDTTQITDSSRPDLSLRVSRRDVIITGTASIGLLTTAGVSSASNHETSSEEEGAPGTNSLTITVTGLEIDGPLEDCEVAYENERQTTDESGTVVVENGDGPYEVTLRKEGWENETETIEAEGDTREVHVPMHVDDPLSE